MVMNILSRQVIKRRSALCLIVIMLLHWTFGACAAIADTLCLEPSGQVVLETPGQPCVSKAGAQGKHCLDIQVEAGHDDHASVPGMTQLVSPDSLGVVCAPIWPLPTSKAFRVLPATRGPPVPLFALMVRETTYLLI